MAGRGLREQVGRQVAEPAQVHELREVAGEVRAPVTEPRVPHAHRRNSFQTFPFPVPFEQVAFRRSTTSGACRTMSSYSIPEWEVTMTTQSTPAGSSGVDGSPCSGSSPTYGSWYETSAPSPWRSSISFSAGDSRVSSMSAL